MNISKERDSIIVLSSIYLEQKKHNWHNYGAWKQYSWCYTTFWNTKPLPPSPTTKLNQASIEHHQRRFLAKDHIIFNLSQQEHIYTLELFRITKTFLQHRIIQPITTWTYLNSFAAIKPNTSTTTKKWLLFGTLAYKWDPFHKTKKNFTNPTSFKHKISNSTKHRHQPVGWDKKKSQNQKGVVPKETIGVH